MHVVLDASVVIAAARPSEAAHGAARLRLRRCVVGEDVVVAPPMFLVEVRGTLARLGFPKDQIAEITNAVTLAPHRIVTMGPRAARKAARIAVAAKLRGADAAYVWVAHRENLPLCTLDEEMAERCAAFCEVISP